MSDVYSREGWTTIPISKELRDHLRDLKEGNESYESFLRDLLQIPMPPRSRYTSKYGFGKMKINTVLSFPLKPGEDDEKITKLKSAAHSFASRNEWSFSFTNYVDRVEILRIK